MIELSPELAALIMLGGILLGVLSGFPLAIPIGTVGLVIGFLLFGSSIFDLMTARLFDFIKGYTVLAIPLFVFMGSMLERSGIAEKMFNALYLWFGGLNGGLAFVTVLLGTILAACVGVIAASVTLLALVALPSMLKRGYDKSLAAGSVCAGGCLGILIPPSIMLVIYGPMAGISVGKLFMAAFLPGLTLSAIYMVYILTKCSLQPQIAPPIPAEERTVPFMKKATLLITSMVPTVILVVSVLGVIFLGVAPPTEAAAAGAVAATILAIAYRNFSWKALTEVTTITFRVTSMIYLIGGCSIVFTAVFLSAGGGKAVASFLLSAPGGTWGSFGMIMFIIFILGFFIDWQGILFIMVPVVTPVFNSLGFDPLWFAMMVCVNLQMAFMTPPFAVAIFYVRGIADPSWNLTMGDIIRGVVPFVILIIVGLGLCTAFPEIILWLPGKMIK